MNDVEKVIEQGENTVADKEDAVKEDSKNEEVLKKDDKKKPKKKSSKILLLILVLILGGGVVFGGLQLKNYLDENDTDVSENDDLIIKNASDYVETMERQIKIYNSSNNTFPDGVYFTYELSNKYNFYYVGTSPDFGSKVKIASGKIIDASLMFDGKIYNYDYSKNTFELSESNLIKVLEDNSGSSSVLEGNSYYIYLYKDKNNIIYKVPPMVGTEEIIKYEVKSKDAVLYDFTYRDGKVNAVLYYDDNKIYVIDEIKKEKKEVSLPKKYDGYSLKTNSSTNELIGFTYKNGKYENFYNLRTMKSLYNDKYTYLSFNNDTLIGYIFFNEYAENSYGSEEQSDLLELDYEKVIISKVGECASYSRQDSFTIILSGCNSMFASKYEVLDASLKTIVTAKSAYDYSIYKNNLYLIKDNKVEIYNSSGNLVKTTKAYDNIKQVINNYIVYEKNKNLYITDDNIVDVKLGPAGTSYHQMLSKYYNANSLAHENEKKAGIYIIVGTNSPYAENGGGINPGIEYYFNPDTKEVARYDLDYIGAYAKPVLYLYPKKNNTKVTVSFENSSLLTTTYPKYNKEWKVVANKNGDLYDKSGRYYYGLYWEESGANKVDFSTGFYVEKDDALKFLEEKLDKIGLTQREANEFIMYWLPILEKNGKNLVYFELTEERDSYNKINISPKPDSILRMAIHVKKVDQKVDIKEEKLTKFKRSGFAAVEWGGVNY